MTEGMRFAVGERVRILVDAPPAWAGEWGATKGDEGVITGRWDEWGSYGVLLDDDPYQLSASFRACELDAAS